MKSFSQVYQFHITLLDIRPAIWRRIEVPESYSFWDLHVAIQDAMGWLDCHLHEFEIIDPKGKRPVRIGLPDEDFPGVRDVLAGWTVPIARYFRLQNPLAFYRYDFGDGWEHEIRLEEVQPRQPRRKYPRCLEGARACPPEDVGGVGGYRRFLKAIKDPRHPEHRELLGWAGGSFDPDRFNPARVRFDDPNIRFEDL
ncbi:MAG: plasmid pRiA4b ORF-3 family protein [Acidobacteriota bacterium]